MKTVVTSCGCLATLLTLTGLASAQVFAPSGIGYGSYGFHHSSTFEEGVLRGFALENESIGHMNYYNSLAAINLQDAYSRYLKNRAQEVDTYFYTKEKNREFRQKYDWTRLTNEQYAALARSSAPSSLGSRDYDRAIGRLYWPSALHGDQFSAERDALEVAFRSRSPGDYGAGSDFYSQVRQITTVMQDKLRDQFESVDAAQYMAAFNFLKSLAYEAQQPIAVRPVAMR